MAARLEIRRRGSTERRSAQRDNRSVTRCQCSSAVEAVRSRGECLTDRAECAGWHASRAGRQPPGFQSESRILKRMNAAILIVLLAAPFAILAALIAVLIVYLGNRTK